MTAPVYAYRCRIDNVVDGDTIDALIDLGFHLHALHRIRLLGINTPELRSGTAANRQAGAEARDFTSNWIAAHELHKLAALIQGPGPRWPFVIHTAKADSFGRWLGTITVADDPAEPALNEALITAGHAVAYRAG